MAHTPNPEVRIDNTALLKWEHCQCAAGVIFRAYSTIDHLIERFFISVNGRYKLCRLQLDHRRSGKDLSIEQ